MTDTFRGVALPLTTRFIGRNPCRLHLLAARHFAGVPNAVHALRRDSPVMVLEASTSFRTATLRPYYLVIDEQCRWGDAAQLLSMQILEALKIVKCRMIGVRRRRCVSAA